MKFETHHLAMIRGLKSEEYREIIDSQEGISHCWCLCLFLNANFLDICRKESNVAANFLPSASIFSSVFPFPFLSPGKIHDSDPLQAFTALQLSRSQGIIVFFFLQGKVHHRYLLDINSYIAHTFWQQENVFSCALYNFVQLPFPIDQENSGLKCIK
jgi:hypothetical protein